MSNPTELPDLDLNHLEALARAATPGPWSWWTSNSVLRLTGDDGIDGGVLHAYSHRGHADICCGESDRAFMVAANPAAVLALIALARRAQPEGEAPQAEPAAKVTCPGCHGIGTWIGQHDGYDDADCHMFDGAGKIAALAAQQAAAPGALALLNAEEMAALHRFQETCQDFDSGGYDVDKNMMKRLAAIGVIESKGFNRYQFTEFGDYVVEHYAPSAPGTPEAPKRGAQLLAELLGAPTLYSQVYVAATVDREWSGPAARDAAEAAAKEYGDTPAKTVEGLQSILDEVLRVDGAAQLDGGQGEGEKA